MLTRFNIPTALTVLILFMAGVAFAQSTNTASIVVTIVDPNGAVVKGAQVSVVNSATGAHREAVSGDEGTATIAGQSEDSGLHLIFN